MKKLLLLLLISLPIFFSCNFTKKTSSKEKEDSIQVFVVIKKKLTDSIVNNCVVIARQVNSKNSLLNEFVIGCNEENIGDTIIFNKNRGTLERFKK